MKPALVIVKKDKVIKARATYGELAVVLDSAIRLIRQFCENYDIWLTNKHHSPLTFVLEINSEISDWPGCYNPEINTIFLYKRFADNRNLLKEKKLLKRVIVHELVHYLFCDFGYKEDGAVAEWVVGVCPPETPETAAHGNINTGAHIAVWLDEVFTETITNFIMGVNQMPLYSQAKIRPGHEKKFQEILGILKRGKWYLDDIIEAMINHDHEIFLNNVKNR